MSGNQTRSDRRVERPGSSRFVDMPCCSESMDGQRNLACPCAGWVKRHRLAAYTAFAVAGLCILALQAGWILGIVAFFRTL